MSLLRGTLALVLLNAPLAWSGDARVLPSTGPVRLPAAEAKALRKALADAKLLSQDEDVNGATLMCMRGNAPPRAFYSAALEMPKNESRSTEPGRAMQALCKLVSKRFADREGHSAGSTAWDTPPLRIRGKGAEVVVEHDAYEPSEG